MEVITIFNDVEKNKFKLKKFFYLILFDFKFLYQLEFFLSLEISKQRLMVFYLCFE